jgi:hypothetical protein
VPAADTELVYALRLALKAQLERAADADLAAWRAAGPAADAQIADVAVAVPSPVSAAFLLGHLERTAFAGERAGEFARHAMPGAQVRRLYKEDLRGEASLEVKSLHFNFRVGERLFQFSGCQRFFEDDGHAEPSARADHP